MTLEKGTSPNPEQTKSTVSKRTLFHLIRRIVESGLSDEERGEVTSQLIEMQQPENQPGAYLAMLHDAFERQDKEELRFALDALQKKMEEGGKTRAARLSDNNLDVLLRTREGMLSLGSGTQGCRIYIDNGELFMPSGDEISQQYGRIHQQAFRRFFNLTPEDEMRVKF